MRKLILVCGAGRTGTTLLDVVLGTDPQAFSCGEVNAWFRKYRAHHFNIVCSCGHGNDCAVWQKIGKVKQSTFHNNAFAVLNKQFIVDSSKDIDWIVDSNRWAIKNNFEAVNLLMYKEPLDHYHSYWKRGHSLEQWQRTFVNYYKRFLALKIPYVSISYSDLVHQQLKVLESIFINFRIDGAQYQKKVAEQIPHLLYGSAGISRQLKEGKLIIREDEWSLDYLQEREKIINRLAGFVDVKSIIEEIKQKDLLQMKGEMARELGSQVPLRDVYYYFLRSRKFFKYFFNDRYNPKD